MSPDEFLAFNQAWIERAGHHLVDGGVVGTFIDWRGYPTVHAAATAAGLDPLNVVVWSKTNAGMGSLYRSAHELLPLYKKGRAGARQQCRAWPPRALAVERLDISGRLDARL
jgi:DNA modification methylase